MNKLIPIAASLLLATATVAAHADQPQKRKAQQSEQTQIEQDNGQAEQAHFQRHFHRDIDDFYWDDGYWDGYGRWHPYPHHHRHFGPSFIITLP